MGLKKLLTKFYKGKTILITGNSGFIGSWLSIWLKELGSELIGYSLSPRTNYDNFNIASLEDRMINYYSDIRNYSKLTEVINNHKPEIIFHLAAQPIVRRSYDLPKETFDTNICGTINVLEIFRKIKECRILINFTSDKCYQNKGKSRRYKETDELGGRDPYSSSKACSELITSAYCNSFFKTNKSLKKAVSSIRAGNVIGGGDWQEDRLIPDCIKALKSDKTILLRNPKAIRPWQFVLEPLRGCLMLILLMWKNPRIYSGSWNFGPHSEDMFTVQEITEKIIKFWGSGEYRSSKNKDTDKQEENILLLDCNKSYRYLKWKPILSLDESIKFTIDWYKEEELNYAFDVDQINKYLELVNNRGNDLINNGF
jgi:CDP-glucose 4,6-dehydratase